MWDERKDDKDLKSWNEKEWEDVSGRGNLQKLRCRDYKEQSLKLETLKKPDQIRGALLANLSLGKAEYQVLVWFCHLFTMCGLGRVMQHQPWFLHPSHEVNTTTSKAFCEHQ